VIPLVDLKAQHAVLRDEIADALERVLESSQFIMGPEVEGFENELSETLEARHAIGVASGTAALHLALVALGIGPGDEVITSPHTFVATAEAILHAGATPVFVDVDERSYNIDATQIERGITAKTRAIMPVHLYGRPADMDKIMGVAEERSLLVVEDAAQAHGATFGGHNVGSIGDAGAFSFYPGKNLGALGDAGAIVTKRDDVAEAVRRLRNHGRQSKYLHDQIGYGERLDALQAAVLRVKLRYLHDWNRKRHALASHYKANLKESLL
jgi:dTDP-4-amino-4,6-dideoxygalactose transaminase